MRCLRKCCQLKDHILKRLSEGCPSKAGLYLIKITISKIVPLKITAALKKALKKALTRKQYDSVVEVYGPQLVYHWL